VAWTVRAVAADRPPHGREPSAGTAAEQLSPLLLGVCFRFGIVWGLFLGLVRPSWLRDLGKLVWESLIMNLGYRPSSLLGEEFLSAPIHSPPLSGRLIGPSLAPPPPMAKALIASPQLVLGRFPWTRGVFLRFWIFLRVPVQSVTSIVNRFWWNL
jgi:hypothetical protein